jgi:hypothetical protein
MSLKTIRSVSVATLGAVLLTVVGCAPAPSAPAGGGNPTALPTNAAQSTAPAGAAKPEAKPADDQAGSTTGATESSEK